MGLLRSATRLVADLPDCLDFRLSINGYARSNVIGPGPDGGWMNSSPMGVSLSGTPEIHPVLLSGAKLGTAAFSAIAGQLSVAAAITPASRRRGLPGDLALVMWGIGASSISDLGATRFSGKHSIANKVAGAMDFDH